MQLDSVLVHVDTPEEVARLADLGADVLDWRGYLASVDGGPVAWRSALVRLPADTAVRLGLVVLGEGLHDRAKHDAAVSPATAPATSPTTATRTSTGTAIVAPRRPRSRRRPRRAIPCETAGQHRPASDAPNTGLSGRGIAPDTDAIAPSPQPARPGGILSESRLGAQHPSETQHTSKGEGQDIDAHPTGGH